MDFYDVGCAITKDQHDEMTRNRERPLTQAAMGLRGRDRSELAPVTESIFDVYLFGAVSQ